MSNMAVHVLRCGATQFQERGFSVRYLSGFHVFHLHLYHGTFKLGEAYYPLTPGTVTLSPSGTPSYYDLKEPGRHLYLHFRVEPDLAFAGGVINDADGFYGGQLRRMILYSGVGRGDDWVNGARGFAASEMVCRHMAECSGAFPSQSIDAIARAQTLLEERFTEPVFVPDLARVVNMSPNYLAKRFKERYGKSIKRRLTEIRMERACYLLQNTDLPVSQVGERCGIPDPQYFNKQFRRKFGVSPTGFRETRP